MKSLCASCKVRRYAENKPDTLVGRIWRWHTRWCPMWRAYGKRVSEEDRSDRM